MVQKRIRAAIGLLNPGRKVKSISAHRFLIILKLTDGTFVVQSEQSIHQPHKRYMREALDLFQKIFNYSCASDAHIPDRKNFQDDNVDWHPVVFDLAYRFVAEEHLRDSNLEGMIVTAIKDHPFYEEHLKQLT